VQCPVCKKDMAYGYLSCHLRNIHGTCPLDVSPVTRGGLGTPADYEVSFPPYCKLLECPIDGCPGRADNRGHLCRYFMFKHSKDSLIIIEEGQLPRCELCDMFLSQIALQGGHHNSDVCKQGGGAQYEAGCRGRHQESERSSVHFE
jgi:hypothetical protein